MHIYIYIYTHRMFETKILRAYGSELGLSQGMKPPNKGNAPGSLTQNILVWRALGASITKDMTIYHLSIPTYQAPLNITRQEGIRNRTEPPEPNRTELFNFGIGWNRTRNRTGPNRTEPRSVRKAQAEPHRTRKYNFGTEPNRTDSFSKSPESKRIEPVPSWA